MEADRRVGDLVRELIYHFQNNPSSQHSNTNPNPNSEDVKYAIRILSSRMMPLILADEAAIANSIKSRLAKQDKLSDALTFTDLYSRFASKTGPGSVKNKRSVLYLLKVISEDRISNPTFQIDLTFSEQPPSIASETSELRSYSSQRLKNGKNGGIITILKSTNNIQNTAFRDFAMLLNEESDVSEEDLVTDVLSVCQGIDGKYVKFDDSVDGYVLLDSIKVSKANKLMICKLCELGWLFRKVNRYVSDNTCENVGTVVKAFCVALEDEVLEYHKLLTVLKSQSMSPIPLVSEYVSSKGYLSLRRLAVWFVEPMVKMRRMAVLVDSCGNLKGGAMAGAIHLHAQHGDPLFHGFMKRLLLRVCSPLFEMVRRWVMEGDLQDLYSEFFVSEQSVKPECLWREGYQIRYLMLPCFISKSLANRILRTGKSINFLKVCCEDHSLADLATDLATDTTSTNPAKRGLGHGETNALESLVTDAEKRIDKHLMYAIFNRYKFKDHCLAIKRFILLGQGDFVQYLMEIMGPVLSEPAKTISLIQLSGLLEKAILSSSAQYDDRDILDRLKVKMMPHGVKDKGWDVFCLHYDIRVPLNTVFTESVMSNYLRIFSFLWKIRRVEHAVLGAWKTMKPNLSSSHFFTKLPKAVRLQILLTSRKCQLLWYEMNNFVTSLQAYVMFEVLEVTWSKFCNEMEAAKDLDDLIAAHDKYLGKVVEKSLVGENSETLYKTILMLFDVILRFTSVADRLYEFRTRDTTSKTKKTSKSKGMETDPWLNEGRKAVTQRAGEFLSILGQDLDAVSKEYASILKGFISQLPTQQRVDLKFLMFRLDFTEFYSLTT
ncbi:hypothetical protein L1987_13845 [Smallanthus sonchifolius]|uniref:Uncharacterized protein n=1 Tax=Smallanthus sonchifolius TaxID=185202 RepID=A0ACB9JI71_9ASTR|nr:hypothetical protein L1987_13845 [Smallanthus sonchifolius]